MARILFFNVPAHGHVNPSRAVVKELVARGHEVIYYNGEAFRETIEATGADFRPYPDPVPGPEDIAEALDVFINAALLLADLSEHLTPFAIAEVAREQPDIVIYDSIALWGYVAARSHNLPHICSLSHFVLDGSQRQIPLRDMLYHLWTALPHIPRLIGWKRHMAREFGRENAGGITEYGDLNLVFTSRAFHPANDFVDERFRFVGPSIDPALRDVTFDFDQLGAGPLVYVSLGTVNYLDADFYRATFAAFRDYPAQFVLAAGQQTDIGPVPANFIVRSFVPQLAVLQRADAFITHGGINSVQEGLYYGVPEVVVPHQIEQLLNAKRVVESGAGLLLGDSRPYGQVTAETLREALDTVLNQPDYRENAARIGKTLQEAGGYRRAVDEIELFLRQESGRALSLSRQRTE